MSLTIRERLALQDAADRRALSQRMLRAGEVRHEQHESNVESLRSMSMLAGAIFALAFVLVCAVAGIAAADWWSGGAPLEQLPPHLRLLVAGVRNALEVAA